MGNEWIRFGRVDPVSGALGCNESGESCGVNCRGRVRIKVVKSKGSRWKSHVWLLLPHSTAAVRPPGEVVTSTLATKVSKSR
jgi:hypothetical protein